MLRLATNENFSGHVVRALRHRVPGIDLVRVQDTGMHGAEDPDVLAWAADQGRLLLSHDVQTMVGFAYDRVRQGHRMPGLVEVPLRLSPGTAADDLHLIAACSAEDEYEGRVIYLPL